MSELVLYNTLSKKKEPFKSLVPKKVSFYLCGVTVYDDCHIGHARAYIVFDTIRRHLMYLGYDVAFIQNFTDIDDKIIKRSIEKGTSWKALVKTNIASFFEDMDALNILRASAYPKATDHIREMISIIKDLMEKGVAYQAGDDICFSVDAFKDYGKLSKKKLEDLVAGSRVEVSKDKKNPFDFVLWKPAKAGEPFWGSPWGKGRPGWHIECSAMVKKLLGNTIDIHAGGEDLVFPHHENEIAQSECHTDHPLANYWLHNGFVKIKDEKMSKSKNNFFTIKDIVKDTPGVVLRYFLMKVHYRLPIHFSSDGLEESKQAVQKLAEAVKAGANVDSLKMLVPISAEIDNGAETSGNAPQNRLKTKFAESSDLSEFLNRFDDALNNDFNFSEAVSILFDLSRYCYKNKKGGLLLFLLAERLGLNLVELESEIIVTEELRAIIQSRNEAKKNKDFDESDRLRDVLKTTFGVEIVDQKDGGYLLKEI
ncbi:cysteine--tRNA ligase [bacterium]|nr:cysteine--tRNA ligase [bacterium]